MQLVKGSGHPEPAGHCRRLDPAHPRHRGYKYAAVAHRAAHEDNLQFDDRANGNLFGTKEKHTCRADIASNQSYWKLFRDRVDAAEAQRKFQGCAWIFTLLAMDSHRMGR